MKLNVGGLDRTLRIIIGAALLVLGLFIAKSGILTALFAGLGAILILTALFGFCPIWHVLGINTCKVKNAASN